MFPLIWLAGGIVTALVVVFDMRRMGACRIGLQPAGWVVVSVCLGPITAAVYLSRRSRARQALIDAVWVLVGDQTVPVQIRRKRLAALGTAGVVGAGIYRVCAAVLDAELPVETEQTSPARATPADLDRPL